MARPDSNSVGGRLILPFLLVASLAMTGSESSLADAAKKRDTAAIQALLINHSDVNAPQIDGTTVLHWAAHWDDLFHERG